MSSNHIDRIKVESEITNILKNIYDPEIPLNIYDLGLIYDISIDNLSNVEITMTLTAPNCPEADYILYEIKRQVENLPEVNSADVMLVFDPPWDKDMLSEEAKLELGLL